MTDPIASVEELYSLPSANVPPHSAREEIITAAKTLRTRDNWTTNTLMWWLVDTATLHAPDANGDCDRDHDRWPCNDITAARKVAETIHIIGTTPLGDAL